MSCNIIAHVAEWSLGTGHKDGVGSNTTVGDQILALFNFQVYVYKYMFMYVFSTSVYIL
jgi:hypothetical protein